MKRCKIRAVDHGLLDDVLPRYEILYVSFFFFGQEFHEEVTSKNNDVERLTKILTLEPKSPGRHFGR